MKDTRIKQPTVNVKFCLKLPQSLYDSEIGVAEPVINPTKTKPTHVNLVSRKSLLFAEYNEELDGADESDDDYRIDSTSTSTLRSGTTMPSTTSMSMIVGLKTSGSQRSTYCGDLPFLDYQDKFVKSFRLSPFLLNEKPNTNGTVECMICVRAYADKYILDIFLVICREDYVGAEDVGSKRKLVHEICKFILDIKQE